MAKTRGLEPEEGNTIGNLTSNTPLEIDPISQGQEHIRAIKRATQASFPSIGSSEVTLTATQMENDFLLVYKGMIAHFVLAVGAPIKLPVGWYVCDGIPVFDVSIPNLLDKHLKVASAIEPTGTEGGLNSITLVIENVGLKGNQLPAHTHPATLPFKKSSELDDGSVEDTTMDNGAVVVTTSTVGGNPVTGEADPHIHPITEQTRNNQAVHMVTVAAIYLGLEEDQ